MKIMLPILLLVAALFGILALLPEPAPDTADAEQSETETGEATTALVNARVFDGTDTHERSSLLIAGSRVRKLGPEIDIPEDAAVIDATGHTVLPGLIDAHVHSFGSARRDALRFGVTTMLDMFRPPFDFDQIHAERESLAPTERADLFSAGFLATAPDGHGTQYGIEVPTLTRADAAAGWVAARKREGSDWLKIVIEPGWDQRERPTLDAATVEALAEAANENELMAVAHVSTLDHARMAIEAGVDGLVHLFGDRRIHQAFIDAALEAGIFAVPTTPVLAAAYGHDDTDWISPHPVLGPRLTDAQRQSLQARFPGTEGAEGDAERWANLVHNIQALHDAGVPILAGSDAPNPGTTHGASLHHALRLLVEAGLAPAEALRAATSVPARAFGLTQRGCLQPGCRADLVIVDGDPNTDIGATAQIESVWKNGRPVEFAATEKEDSKPAPTRDQPARDQKGPINLFADPDRWMAAADDYMGGASQSSIAWTEGENSRVLRVSAQVAQGHAFPYAGAMWFAGAVPMQPVDHSALTRLVLELDGPPGEYQALLFSGESQNVPPARVAIEAGRLTTIQLDSVGGLDLERLRAVGVFASGQPRELEFNLVEARLE